ncbi:MAG: hypothetical protein ACKO66_04495 [Flavobacteriales bacterium]
MKKDAGRLQFFDNLHIVLLLIKDMSWCMMYKTLGASMIGPTMIAAAIILYRTRDNQSAFVHNLAVLVWISANSLWMLGEMFCHDCTKPYALGLFIIGLVILGVYYLYALLRGPRNL